jgi:ABC-type glycerol-3-phosphate transport system substrate-binding protein
MRTTVHLSAVRWAFLAVGLLLLAGCVTAPTPAGTQTITPSPSRALQPSPTPTSAPAIAPDSLTLTWWTPEFLSPKAPQPAGPLLAKQLAEFEAASGNKVRVSPVLKARYGKGGLLDFLLAAQPVAPGVLPDLIALDVSELEAAATSGLLQPLESLLDDMDAGLYPFATSAGRFGDHLLAVQFAADLEHLAYRTDQVKTPPGTWQELLEAGTPYLFPIGSPQSGAAGRPSGGLQPAVLSQYLSAGAGFDPVARQLAVEAEPLLRLLTFYDAGMKAGVIPPNALELSDPEALWGIYSQGQVPMADVSARHYLAEQGSPKNSGFAPAPGWGGPVVPVAGGWALAITTTDPVRQRAAADLIAWLLKPENAGSWASAAGWLPTSPAALKSWGATPHNEFLDRQLAAAASLPIGLDSIQAETRIQKAIEAVLKGDSTPAAAVEAAMNPSK